MNKRNDLNHVSMSSIEPAYKPSTLQDVNDYGSQFQPRALNQKAAMNLNESNDDMDNIVAEVPQFNLTYERDQQQSAFKMLANQQAKSHFEEPEAKSTHQPKISGQFQLDSFKQNQAKHVDINEDMKQTSSFKIQESSNLQSSGIDTQNNNSPKDQEMRETSYFQQHLFSGQPSNLNTVREVIQEQKSSGKKKIETKKNKDVFKVTKVSSSNKRSTEAQSNIEPAKIKSENQEVPDENLQRSKSHQITIQAHQIFNDNSPDRLIDQTKKQEIKEVQQQIPESKVTGNFGLLNIQKQTSTHNQHNYSALKGPEAHAQHNNESESSAERKTSQHIMFTSMSDIGFPGANSQKTKTGELITQEQVSRVMDTQNNWRIRTKTIDEMLKDVRDRVNSDPAYIMRRSQSLVQFFVQLLQDQNFKIVLNTLNILNMILGMKHQQLRHQKPANEDVWGLTNNVLGRQIPPVVKKLADSKNIIRQEASQCLFSIFEIMKSGQNVKDNNFIALVLPYLNNSSNWHIREELLYLLIKCFLKAENPLALFDPIQILDSVLHLFNDNKEKIRNLSLEAIAAFSSVGFKNKLLDIMYHNNVDKEICDLVNTRLDYGMHPFLNADGNLEIPYQEQLANFDADSVAQSIANQSQQPSYQDNVRRGPSAGAVSQASFNNKARGNSSGRKIVVATAKTNSGQMSVSHRDKILEQDYLQNKRTASANNPQQLEMDAQNLNSQFIDHVNGNSFSYSVGGGPTKALQQQLDDLRFVPDFNNSSFLPQLNSNSLYKGQFPQRERDLNTIIDPTQVMRSAGSLGGNPTKNSKYIHGTPGHPSGHQAHFKQHEHHFHRGNSGKVGGISNHSPSMFDQNTHFLDMSGHLGSYFGAFDHKHGMMPQRIDQQMSEIAINEFSDRLSTGEAKRIMIHQTPQQLSHMHGDFDHSLQNQGAFDFTPLPGGQFGGFLGIKSPLNADHESQNMSSQTNRKDLMNNPNIGLQKPQNTFYSDGTAFTGITATTGATSSMKNKNPILKVNNLGNVHATAQHQQRSSFQSSGVGPIKATKAALGSNQMILEQELCIDNRKKSSSQHPNKIKITTRVQTQKSNETSSQQQLDSQQQVRSISHHNKNETYSADVKQISDIFSRNETEEEEANDLVANSSKVVYLLREDLEDLQNPEKEYKKCIAANQGIFSSDWVEQFESCNKIRQICKHQQRIMIQNGNMLQNIIATLIKLADSLRSALSRISMMTLADMFLSLKRVMEPFLMPIAQILFKKCADTNNFIAEEAEKCFSELVQNCQESKVLAILMQCSSSKSNIQRLKICQMLQQIVKQLGNNILFFKDNDKLIVQLAKYLQDACQDVRQVSKGAFITMNRAIMGQHDLEKLLQRVLNDQQYKKVREFLDKEPSHSGGNQGSQRDFVIINATNHSSQSQLNKKNSKQQQSFKTLRYNGLSQKQSQTGINTENTVTDNSPLNIQAKSILNPQKNDTSAFLNRVALQNKSANQALKKSLLGSQASEPELDQAFQTNLKEVILKIQQNDWKQRLEGCEQLFDLIKSYPEHFKYSNSQVQKQYSQVETADCICKLISDPNAKIQISVMENLQRVFNQITPLITKYVQIIYKSTIQNLGSTNLSVRKNSEQVIKLVNDLISDKSILIQATINMIQYNSTSRIKPALIDQLIDLLDLTSAGSESQIVKVVLPASYKLLDDNKNEVKTRTDRLIKKLFSMPSVGQLVIDSCPQAKMQRVCELCIGSSQKTSGSSGKNSSGYGTGNFGANGNSVHLNQRA